MNRPYILLTLIILLLSCKDKKKEVVDDTSNTFIEEPLMRSVENNTLISNNLPNIEIKAAKEFDFIGKFDFEIIASSDEYSEEMLGKPIAAGERFVFVSADKDNSVNKLFIVQLEGFLPENELIYNYNFDNAEYIGKNKYRHNTWYYDTNESIKENPLGEWAKTVSFLKKKNFNLEDHIMMSRFVGLASEDRKNEIIIFYHEMLKKTTGYTLEEYEKLLNAEEIDAIRNSFVERSRKSFDIIKG